MDPIIIGIGILIVLVIGGAVLYLRRRSSGSTGVSPGGNMPMPRPASRPAAPQPDVHPQRGGASSEASAPEMQDQAREREKKEEAPPRQETDILPMPAPPNLDDFLLDEDAKADEFDTPDWLSEETEPEPSVDAPVPAAPPRPPSVPQPSPIQPPIIEIPKEAEREETPEPKPVAAGPPGEVVQFSAFHPKEIAPELWYSLLFYVHLEGVLTEIQKDAEKFKGEMGGDPRRATSRQQATLARGTVLRIVPEGDGLEFNPPEVTLKWLEDYERAIFRFRASADLLNQPAVGEIGIYTGLIEIARVRFAAFVTEDAPLPNETPPEESDTEPQNALRAAELRSNTTGMYNRIFISYSRKDTSVAASYRLAQLACGNDVFMDSESIRAGENWQAALANAIRDADIFQLFWSENTAQSPNCRDEWDYALQYRCPDNRCEGFIRPVYWRKPLHNPPPELGHLNFRYVPFEDEE